MVNPVSPLAPPGPPLPSAGQEAARQPVLGGQSAAVQRDAVVRAASQQRVAAADPKEGAFRNRRRRGYVDPFRSRGSRIYEEVQEWGDGGLPEEERGWTLDVES
jgi:hypothetical protein